MRMPVLALALADLAHEWRGALVSVLAVTVALAPLMILFGLWSGVVETMRERLARDPANLEIRHRPIEALDAGWFETVRARPEVGFLVPRTRYVNLQVPAVNRADEDAEPADVVLRPTAAGDPLLARGGAAVPEGDAIVLGERAAEALSVTEGDRVTLVLGRIAPGGRRERTGLELTVTGVLPAAVEGGRTGYAPLGVLLDIQRYQEWVRVEERGWPGDAEEGDSWGGFRLYARSIDDVEPLRAWLAGQGFDVTSAADRIAFARRVDRDLGALFAAIAGMTVAGFAATVGLGQVAAVAQKRRSLGVLRLIGYRARALMWFPVIQASVQAGLGAALALGVFWAMRPVMGALFRDILEAEGGLLALSGTEAGVAVAASMALAAISSAVAARQAMAIEPSETLNDG